MRLPFQLAVLLLLGSSAWCTAAPADKSTGEYRAPRSHVVISGYVEPATAKPGDTVTLVLSATPDKRYHVYALEQRDPDIVSKPTLVVLEVPDDLKLGTAKANAQPIAKTLPADAGGTVRYHESPVTWTIPLKLPSTVTVGAYPIQGIVGYQACTEVSCDLPTAARYSAAITIATQSKGGRSQLEFSRAKYLEAARLAANGRSAAPANVSGTQDAPPSLWSIVLFGFLGGCLLNLMPCVLPVIGIKILSFVEQSGHHRSRILALNLWYTVGVLAVFLALATAAAFMHLAWGRQFSSTAFNVSLAGIIFVMALSFLGVWEIPLPGFVASGAATKMAAREGAFGAFSKGVLTTLVATPCSGPFLGPVFGYALKQTPETIYLIFGSIGLGMSSPYLLIGAFPRLMSSLPRPGAWMDTFKQLMGFVLLGTVVVLFSFLEDEYVVPSFGLLVALWLGCWWIGRVSLAETFPRKLRAWVEGCAAAAAIGYLSFVLLGPRESILDWQQFSRTELARLNAEGKTVLVDFTAKSCLTCKLNFRWAIDTLDVKAVVDRNGVVPMIANFDLPEVQEVLGSLGYQSIPVLVIYPPQPNERPIILPDLLTQSKVLDGLEAAGPSLDRRAVAKTAMRAE